MLNYLTLTNVRKHESTHIDFSGDGQLISLAGLNGAGKSTVLEAILYALYGETRHGRSGIANMVRRGAEHEGMEVSIGFTLDGVTYDVSRRYEKGKSTASLKAAGVETMRSVGAVSTEVARILGMDSAGFKLATIAKQKELDGLADLTPSKRRAAVSRLLRLDAIAAAAKTAREEYVRAKELARALAAQADIPTAERNLGQAQDFHNEASVALSSQRTVVENLRKSILDGSELEREWDERARAVSVAEARLTSASLTVDQLSHQIDCIVVAQDPGVFPPSSEVQTLLEEVNANIAIAEASARSAETRSRVGRDLSKALSTVAELDVICGSLHTAENDLDAANSELAVYKGAVIEAETTYAELHVKYRVLAGSLDSLNTRAHKLASLGGVCSLCEQNVDEGHKRTQEEQAQEELNRVQVEVETSKFELDALGVKLAQLRKDASKAEGVVEVRRDAKDEFVNAGSRREDILQAIESYEQTLSRLPEGDANPDELYASKGVLEAQRATSLQAEKIVSARANALASRAGLQQALALAEQTLSQARTELTEATPSDELVKSFDELCSLREELSVENDILTACSDNVQEAAGAVRVAKTVVASAQALSEQASIARNEAVVASRAHEVLGMMAKTLSSEIRPALQAEVSTLLAILSEGRFTRVEVGEDYSVSVADTDGKMHAVSEFSGGESDLIALAIRLALAQIVAKRNGAHASGFLILDEVLGSQDAGRRLAILEGLRRLRSTYGQILLISHVGGLEDASDRVINIEEVDGIAVAS